MGDHFWAGWALGFATAAGVATCFYFFALAEMYL